MEDLPQLRQYNNTQVLYKAIKEYMGKYDIQENTPKPIVAVYVNKCIKHFHNKNKPKVKVLYLCIQYLESIDYY